MCVISVVHIFTNKYVLILIETHFGRKKKLGVINIMFITGGIMWVIIFFAMPPSPRYATAAHLDRELYNRIANSSHNKAAGIGFVSAFTKENTDEDIVDVSSDCNTDPATVTSPTVDVFTAPTSMTSDGDENLMGGPAVGAEILPMQASSDYNANTFVDTATHTPEDTRIVREFTDANIHARQDYVNRASNVLSRRRRALTFTDPSTLLLIFGLGTPLQLDSESVIVGLFTKMIYTLPTNSTDFTEPGMYFGRTKSRWSIYKVLERAAELYGFGAGKGCMLRAICEVAATPFNLHHGLFGEMVQAFLSPSSTNEVYDEYSDQEYHASERLGKHPDQNCHALYPECERNVLDIFSTTVVTSTPTSTSSTTTQRTDIN